MNNNLKFTNATKVHHGDVQVFSIENIPSNAVKLEKNTFIAKSENSGHAHALCGDYDMYELPTGGFCVNVKGELAVMNHAKYEILTDKALADPKETAIADHKPVSIPKGVYFIGIQRRVNPFAKVWEIVRD